MELYSWESGFEELRINKTYFKTLADMIKGSCLSYLSNRTFAHCTSLFFVVIRTRYFALLAF